MSVNVWLDDLPHEQRPIPEGWLHVKTVDEAKAILLLHNVQELSLDHDLGACNDCTRAVIVCCSCGTRGKADIVKAETLIHKIKLDIWICLECGGTDMREDWNGVMANCSHFGTGYDLCLWMAEHGVWPKSKPTVHSLNPVGRKRMQDVINRYYISPEAQDESPRPDNRPDGQAAD